MSRYITKYMNLEKSKQPTFWTEGVRDLQRHDLNNKQLPPPSHQSLCSNSMLTKTVKLCRAI